MTAREFIEKWSAGGANYAMTEKAGAQQHFIELCQLLGVDSPNDVDSYTFEKGTKKLGSDRGFADVFKRGAFAWENKGPNADLKAALKQLKMYASALENPPLLVVSDRLVIEVHTQFTGTPTETHRFTLKDLADPARCTLLRKVWTQPEAFKPKRTSRDITEAAAKAFAEVANRMRDERHVAPERVAHFLTQCVFCFFAEDAGLLPHKLFDRLVSKQLTPEKLHGALVILFETMRDGGLFGTDDIPWFNGGLFKTIDIPMLTPMDVTALRSAAQENWSAIDVSIFGTLFERGLDPKKRSQLGAHYTDPETIMRIINPVVLRPLQREWAAVAGDIDKEIKKSKKSQDAAWKKANNTFSAWLERLKKYRVLDPACGSGNFLYLALRTLKDFELTTHIEAETLGLHRPNELVTSPANVLGIELNEYAAELARVTVWIGELQWCLDHAYPFKQNPVLEPLDHIENRDALLTFSGDESAPKVQEAQWPTADVIIGNPPFLGGSKKRRELGDDYFEALDASFAPQVPGAADLVCYWFHKAHAYLRRNLTLHVGFVATNSIRGGANRKVLDAIVSEGVIYDAWSDEPWVNDGAAVRVSLVCFAGEGFADEKFLNGVPSAQISGDLAGSIGITVDLTLAKKLNSNSAVCFMGPEKTGPFDIDGTTARDWLLAPNPHGKSNAQVVKKRLNGSDVTGRARDGWVVDFGLETNESIACLFEQPYTYVRREVYPIRQTNKDTNRKKYWWRFGRTGEDLRAELSRIDRYIATPAVAKHFLLIKLPSTTIPDKQLIVTARADDTTFGILHSRFHELWSLRLGTSLEDRPRYTPTTCFETFPFPLGLTPADTAHQRTETLPDGAQIPANLPPPGGEGMRERVSARAASGVTQQTPSPPPLSPGERGDIRSCAEGIARAAKALNDLRERWLNPPEWTQRVPEITPLGMEKSPYPDRILPRDNLPEKEVKALQKRTLTNLYNERPAWLDNAHKTLDIAVANAYGWTDYTPEMPDEEILARLLKLNLERAAAQDAPVTTKHAAIKPRPNASLAARRKVKPKT